MPYRAMFATVITVALALLAVGVWIRAVEPMMAEANAAAVLAPPPSPPSTTPSIPATYRSGKSTEDDKPAVPADVSLRRDVHATLLLCFILICTLLVVGFFATLREWVRYRVRSEERRQRRKTEYVDAWKIAGERLKADAGKNENDG